MLVFTVEHVSHTTEAYSRISLRIRRKKEQDLSARRLAALTLPTFSLFSMKPEPDYYEVSKESDYEKAENGFGETEFDGLNMILNMCANQDGELKSLFRGARV